MTLHCQDTQPNSGMTDVGGSTQWPIISACGTRRCLLISSVSFALSTWTNAEIVGIRVAVTPALLLLAFQLHLDIRSPYN